MAERQHKKFLRQGADRWNVWRHKNPHIRPDLSRCILSNIDLSEFDLSKADLSNSNLSHANLSGVVLYCADFSYTDLSNANLSESNLYYTKFYRTDLAQANFHLAKLRSTLFSFTDLSSVRNLETCQHQEPSSMDYQTLVKSKTLPLSFLQGIGLPDDYIEYLHSLIKQHFQYNTCFISYTEKDNELAQKLYNSLQGAGIRCWSWKEDLNIGQTMWKSIDKAIRIFDKVIIILSEHSLKSQAVQDEITRAFQKERELRKKKPEVEVMFPIRVDDYVLDNHCKYHHKSDLIAKRIGDFRHWKDHTSYQKEFQTLLKALKKESLNKKYT